MHKIATNGKPILSWLPPDCIEESALEQARNVAQLPFTHQHVALMPDAHTGYGVPIGCVFGARDVLIPQAVGYDIGCGVSALQTNLNVECIEPRLDEIEALVRERVPMGVGARHDIPQHKMLCGHSDSAVVLAQWENARCQLGTLGAGNHFIELQRDTQDNVWVMIHSGSRNLGHSICKHYDQLARELNEQWHTQVPVEWDLAFLPCASEAGADYSADMQFALRYARFNRGYMMEEVLNVLRHIFPGQSLAVEAYDCHHNYALLENHLGANVWVHRKGATLARKDTIGIIPGDLASTSYIVRGKGNAPSFTSCSHGAGRSMSRKAAKASLSVADEQRRVDALGVHFTVTEQNLDEASSAYKDIGQVMEWQSDLVSIEETLYPVLPMKG
jgi:tRNA-splicing ligase RtcB